VIRGIIIAAAAAGLPVLLQTPARGKRAGQRNKARCLPLRGQTCRAGSREPNLPLLPGFYPLPDRLFKAACSTV